MPDEWRTTTHILSVLAGGPNIPREEADSAWRVLNRRFFRPIAAFSRRIGLRAADAEDVAQETLLTFLEKHRAGAFDRSKGRLTNWLFGVAQNKARKVRDRHRTVDISAQSGGGTGFFEGQYDSVDAIERIWEEEWTRHMLEVALRRVRPEFSAETFRMFEMASLKSRKPSDVAIELGTEAQAVYDAKHRVLKKLREVRADLEEVELS